MSSGAAMYQVNCPQCSFALKVPAAVLGKKGQCPKCKAVFLIPGVPASSTPAAAPAAQTPLGAPLADPLAGPLGSPLGDPLGGSFGPTDPLFGGAPTQGSPFGSQPYGNQPYGAPGYAAPAANPWAPPPGAANPGGWQAPTASQSMANEYLARAAADQAEAASRAQAESSSGGFFAAERRGIGAGVLGGVIMILIAVVWFVLGLMANRIFFYPPILFCIGIFAIVKGLLEGNYSGR